MKQRKCPSGRHNGITACWDYGSCEECAFGKMIQRYENRIARLKKAAAKPKERQINDQNSKNQNITEVSQ